MKSGRRWLLNFEAILVAGVVQELLQRQVKALGWPHWGQTLWIMGCTLGMLGALVLTLRVLAQRTLSKTQKAARMLPIPLPEISLHAASLAGLFFLYAWVWHLWPPFTLP